MVWRGVPPYAPALHSPSVAPSGQKQEVKTPPAGLARLTCELTSDAAPTGMNRPSGQCHGLLPAGKVICGERRRRQASGEARGGVVRGRWPGW